PPSFTSHFGLRPSPARESSQIAAEDSSPMRELWAGSDRSLIRRSITTGPQAPASKDQRGEGHFRSHLGAERDRPPVRHYMDQNHQKQVTPGLQIQPRHQDAQRQDVHDIEGNGKPAL